MLYFLNVISDIILILATIFLINGLGISKNTNLKYIGAAVFNALLFSSTMFILYECNFKALPVFIYPLMFLSTYKIMYKKIGLSQLYIALITELVISLLSLGITLLLSTTSLSYDMAEKISLLLVRSVVLAAAVIINNKPNFKNIYSISKIIPKHIFVLILLIIVFLVFLTAHNNYPDTSNLKQDIVTALILLLTIVLIITIFSLLINTASKSYYTALNSLLKKQVEAQISHYEKLEKLNNDIRRFRHDYINHLNSINTLIESESYSEAHKYIEKLTESTQCHEIIFNTGNHLADAILTDKSIACKDFADIDFKGYISNKIENSDMCIILANALDNAVEACQKCSGKSKISIAAQTKQGHWTMAMRNPTVGKNSEGLMKTSKEDVHNHGFGLLSIEQAVKRYDGSMKVEIKDGMFEICVVMNIQNV